MSGDLAEGAFGPARWPAPAKINRFLHITGRRDDGYHRLQTLFQFLEWGDELTIALRDDGVISGRGAPPGVPPEADLAQRAAHALRDATGARLGADITIHKRIPAGSGLGGGSSNAATVLVALNTMWECRLSSPELATLGLALGADVPVFVHGHACWAEGVGEVLRDETPDEPWLLLALPDTAVATAAAFRDPALRRDCPPVTMADFASGRCGNVFEPVARRLAPGVDHAMEALAGAGEGAPVAMSGSGSACYAAFRERAAARIAQSRMPAGLRTLVVRATNRSPLRLASPPPVGR